MDTQTLINKIVSITEDTKANSVIYPTTADNTLTDHVVLCCGNSLIHIQAVAHKIIQYIKKQEIKPLGIEGLSNSEWILIDYGNIIVHIMTPEQRDYYQLDALFKNDADAFYNKEAIVTKDKNFATEDAWNRVFKDYK